MSFRRLACEISGLELFFVVEWPAVFAGFIGALQTRPGFLALFFDQKSGPTVRTLLFDRLVPDRKVAFRIAVAAIENFAAFGYFLDDISVATFLGARYSGAFGLNVFAVRVA